jgi:hypothetical protein
MSEQDAIPPEDREPLLRKIWLLRQLHSVVLLAMLLGLFFLATQIGYDGVARITLYCIFGMPFFAAGIAWWDRHWVWKHQDWLLVRVGRGRK